MPFGKDSILGKSPFGMSPFEHRFLFLVAEVAGSRRLRLLQVFVRFNLHMQYFDDSSSYVCLIGGKLHSSSATMGFVAHISNSVISVMKTKICPVVVCTGKITLHLLLVAVAVLCLCRKTYFCK